MDHCDVGCMAVVSVTLIEDDMTMVRVTLTENAMAVACVALI